MAILGAIGIGMAVMGYVIGGKAEANAEAIYENVNSIEANSADIHSVQTTLDTIKTDLSLVRCWVRADIAGSDPATCLVDDRRR